jgi:hypothetical protein
MGTHARLPDSGARPHFTIDEQLDKLEECTDNLPLDVTGARDDPEAALATLLTALATLGLIIDSTTAS